MARKHKKSFILRLILFFFVFFAVQAVFAENGTARASINYPNIDISITQGEGDSSQTSTTLQILFVFIVLALVPTILLMMTGFTRIIIVLHFLRSALGTQQMPPNQVLIGIALFLTFFIMSQPLGVVYEQAYQPYSRGELTTDEFVDTAMDPLREWMFRQVDNNDLALFSKLSGEEFTKNTPPEEIPNVVLIPAFILHELAAGFKFGFVIYIPFIVIDMVVASILMAMGMMMLPPAMISLPFKILLFIMVDGWGFLISVLVPSFR